MRTLLISLAIAAALYAAVIAGLYVTGRRTAAREVAALLPNLLVLFKGLIRDPRVPRRSKVLLGVGVAWVVSPIDLVPEFIPVLGPLDDAVVAALILRHVLRTAGDGVIEEHWRGDPETLRRVLRLCRPRPMGGPAGGPLRSRVDPNVSHGLNLRFSGRPHDAGVSEDPAERRERMALTWKMQIDAPPEAVFDKLADMPNHGRWANENADLHVYEVSGGEPHLGSKYRSEAHFFKKPATADLEITSFDRPRRFAYSVAHHQQGKKDVHLTHTFTLTPQGGGTLVTRTTDGFGNPLVGAIFYPAIKSDGKKSLTNLKNQLEASAR